MKKLLILTAVIGMAAAGCRSDDASNDTNRNNSNYNNGSGMNGGNQNQSQPGTYPNQSGTKGNGNPPQQ